MQAWCKTCPFIQNVEKISEPKQSVKITDHFMCTSINVIYCIISTYCKKKYTSLKQEDDFVINSLHPCDTERNGKGASKIQIQETNYIVLGF